MRCLLSTPSACVHRMKPFRWPVRQPDGPFGLLVGSLVCWPPGWMAKATSSNISLPPRPLTWLASFMRASRCQASTTTTSSSTRMKIMMPRVDDRPTGHSFASYRTRLARSTLPYRFRPAEQTLNRFGIAIRDHVSEVQQRS